MPTHYEDDIPDSFHARLHNANTYWERTATESERPEADHDAWDCTEFHGGRTRRMPTVYGRMNALRWVRVVLGGEEPS